MSADLPPSLDIAANLDAVRERMAQAAQRSGRSPQDVQLVAVSKTQPIKAVAAAYAAGQRDFGENRLEELWIKVREAQVRGLDQIRWHMIGTIQSRKTGNAIGPFVLIHSIDRLKIAKRLSRDAQAEARVMDVLLEVNVSGEASKHGFTPTALIEAASDLAGMSGIRIRGLMTMAPLADDPETVRPIFRELASLRNKLLESCPQATWRHLSMGMTNDFEVAIEEGATIVRIGSAIFGERE